MFSGKLYFNYIYGIGLLGCIAIYCLLNLMSGRKYFSKIIIFITNNFPLLSLSCRSEFDLCGLSAGLLPPAYRGPLRRLGPLLPLGLRRQHPDWGGCSLVRPLQQQTVRDGSGDETTTGQFGTSNLQYYNSFIISAVGGLPLRSALRGVRPHHDVLSLRGGRYCVIIWPSLLLI